MEANQRENQRVPVALRIKLRFRKLDTFISRFATNISSKGMFISSRKPKAEGTLLRFELRLADNSTVIAGRGKVAWVRPYDAAHPKDPHGMGIEFLSLSQGSQSLIESIVEERTDQGMAPHEDIPYAPEAAEAAEEVQSAEEEVQSAEAETEPAETEPAETEPAETEPAETEPAETENVMEAGPQPTELPELPELDALMAGPLDLQAVLQRARELVSTGLPFDKELEALARVSAAPSAQNINEASSGLAQLLGGTPVLQAIKQDDPLTEAPPIEFPQDEEFEELGTLDIVLEEDAQEAIQEFSKNEGTEISRGFVSQGLYQELPLVDEAPEDEDVDLDFD